MCVAVTGNPIVAMAYRWILVRESKTLELLGFFLKLAHTTVRRYSRRFRLKKMKELHELRISDILFHKKVSETAMLELFRSVLALGN